MSRQVRGSLFVDYVRTIRRHRDVDWQRLLGPRELEFLESKVAWGDWYSMEIFEALGVAILNSVAELSYNVPRTWGRTSADQLGSSYEGLIENGSPSGSIMRTHGLRGMFFDFDPVMVRTSTATDATLDINYGMCDVPEAAACYQAIGFYERLVELSGGVCTTAALTERRWEGNPQTVLSLVWTLN